MKKYIIPIICLFIMVASAIKYDNISWFIANKLTSSPKLIIPASNEYAKNKSYKFVQKVDSFIPYSYNDLKNIIYSIIDNGWDSFTFYCPEEYMSCVDDMQEISNDALALTHINNFVHPYNSFTNVKTSILSSGEITVDVSYLYSKEEIDVINKKVDEILTSTYEESNSLYDNIKAIHDYLINTTAYDVTRNEDGLSKFESYKAYGALMEHMATCNGYTDAMAIILNRLNVDNYKIATTPDSISYSSTGHVWNAVYINDKWLHLDLTWDDPVSDDGKNYLYHKYFLINNKQLSSIDNGNVTIEEHNFNKKIYLEFNESI